MGGMHDRYYVCQWPKSVPLPQSGSHPMDERNIRVIGVDHVSRRVMLYFERNGERAEAEQVDQQRSARHVRLLEDFPVAHCDIGKNKTW